MGDMCGELPDRMVFDSTQPCFFTVWLPKERYEPLQFAAIVGHVFSSMVKSVTENGMEAKI
jgi:hypothetical protein